MNFNFMTTLQIILILSAACSLAICLGLAFGFTSFVPGTAMIVVTSLGVIMGVSATLLSLGSIDW